MQWIYAGILIEIECTRCGSEAAFYWKIKEIAQIICGALKNDDFKLDNKYCDEGELKLSWQYIELPECLIVFFSSLFKVPQSFLVKGNLDMEEEIMNRGKHRSSDLTEETSIDRYLLSKKQGYKDNVYLPNYILCYAY